MGKSSINGPLSMAMLNNQRVMGSNANFTGFIGMGHGDSWGYFPGFYWNMLPAVAIDESNPSFYHVALYGVFLK